MRLLIGLILFGLWASIARYYYVCEIYGACAPEEEILENPIPVRPNTLTLTLGDSVILEGYNHFYFEPRISQPTLDSSNQVFLGKIEDYLLDNEDKKLKITGRFLESESDVTIDFSDNLGIARAKAIESLLVDRGIADEIISIDYQPVIGDSVLTEPILFEILEADNDDLADVQFTFTNMTFTESNFEFNSDVFEPKESFLLYADSMKTYFELNPEKKLTIIGHTDFKGTQKYNKGLGYRRANSAKLYLANQVGIQTEIKIESKGEMEPMATNDTEEGQAKNRRVNFVIE